MEQKEKKKLTLKDIGTGRLALIVIAGIVLILCSLPLSGQEQKSDKDVQTESPDPSSEFFVYEEQLEQKLEQLLSKMDGVGKTSVMVTVSQSSERIVKENVSLQTEDSEETDSQGGTRYVKDKTENRTVIYTADQNGNQVPYVVSEKMPVISGVAVVAEGGGDAVIQEQITALLESLLHLEANQISVNRMEGEE